MGTGLGRTGETDAKNDVLPLLPLSETPSVVELCVSPSTLSPNATHEPLPSIGEAVADIHGLLIVKFVHVAGEKVDDELAHFDGQITVPDVHRGHVQVEVSNVFEALHVAGEPGVGMKVVLRWLRHPVEPIICTTSHGVLHEGASELHLVMLWRCNPAQDNGSGGDTTFHSLGSSDLSSTSAAEAAFASILRQSGNDPRFFGPFAQAGLSVPTVLDRPLNGLSFNNSGGSGASQTSPPSTSEPPQDLDAGSKIDIET
ncbi:uncharacterized protein CcaverHIS019_0401650 [Cutaneotrichosporon cavernicola]|uniref:Uncharacterized protein n=1 Tax=Cutaneotrichosporon cavernicola TaxID=279322 RepID=A0AA48L3M9_9TREE|nr:uncharacterized protein CcaverHIS019_0401650 [Cutaneotrichosporon cavernicola]BEI91345.1 hypothetical protein CcaverHIS019_0401650 [Cutaneotrichosporon cavernicola]